MKVMKLRCYDRILPTLWKAMTKRILPPKTVLYFESTLLDFFKKAGREHLPWRREGISVYEVWVSEIMLQQTQVSRVIGYYEKFLKRFPTVESLAQTSWEEFLPYYAGLGYYVRGRNMLRTAKMVVETYGGEFPRDINALQKLPGIGAYTACAIASFAYGADEIAWDTNVRRVIGRFFFGTKHVSDWCVGINSPKLEGREAGKLGRKNTAGRGNIEVQNMKIVERAVSLPAKMLNAALMDFGSAICMGRPKCAACPLVAECQYVRERGKRESGIKTKELGGNGNGGRGNWKEARVILTLHENHEKYFSSVKKSYKPFLVPASHNTRAGIKRWFVERYGLDVAVRPPNARKMMRDIPTLLVNAQILSGVHTFSEFSKEVAREG